MSTSKQPSVMKHLFSMAPRAKLPRSSFDRTSGHKTTFNAGKLVPMYLDEVLPGDSYNMKQTGFLRMATPVYPIMDNLYIDTFWFFVPNRLTQSSWVNLMGERDNPDDSIDFQVAKISNTGFEVTEGDVGDHFGLPLGTYANTRISALPFRGLSLIWNEWFRDQNLQNSRTFSKTDTDSTYSDYSELPDRGKRHDYFTSCLPWPQKGDDVTMPLGSTAPIIGLGDNGEYFRTDGPSDVREDTLFYTNSDPSPRWSGGSVSGNSEAQLFMAADLSNATAATINTMRLAITTQQFLEQEARSGSRYTELNQSFFGVINPDSRLQRPELLAVHSTPVRAEAVSASATLIADPSWAGSALGDVGAVMTGQWTSGFTKSFVEHGYLFGLISVRGDLNYQQGVDRHWSRTDRFDFYFPNFAHLGEQAVLNKEIYHQDSTEDDDVFGYNEVWSEYKYKTSQITGEFRSTAAQPLDAWHLAQEFTTLPLLDDTFIKENPPMDRVIVTEDEPDFICDMYNKLKCARVMPVYSVPGLNRF